MPAHAHVNLLHPVSDSFCTVRLPSQSSLLFATMWHFHHIICLCSDHLMNWELPECGLLILEAAKKRHGRHRMLLHCYTDVYRWSTLKHANDIRSRTNLWESSQWTVTLSMRCGHVQFRRKLWRTPSFWGQVCLESIMSRANKSNCVSSCLEASIVTCHLACWSHIFCFSYVPYVYHGWLPHVPTYVVTLFLAGQRDSWASTRSKYQWDSRHCFCAFAELKLKPMKDSDDFRKANRGGRML